MREQGILRALGPAGPDHELSLLNLATHSCCQTSCGAQALVPSSLVAGDACNDPGLCSECYPGLDPSPAKFSSVREDGVSPEHRGMESQTAACHMGLGCQREDTMLA